MSKVSVIMPAYNAEKYIGEAIDSILAQTFRDFELIIVNDGSTDRTEEIILSYSDPRIVYLKNETNLKISDTLNRGIDIAQGEYIARMDSDDIALPERFERQVAYMDQNPKCVVCGTAAILFGEGMEEKTVVPSGDPRYVKGQMIFHCPIMHPSVFIRQEVLERNNIRYCRDYNGTEDYEMWWRLSSYGEICSLPDPLLKYRISGNQITSQKDYRKQNVHRSFIYKRMDDLHLTISEREADVFLAYANGCANELTIKEVDILLSFLNKLNRRIRKLSKKDYPIYNHVINDVAITSIQECEKALKARKAVSFGYYCMKCRSIHSIKLLISFILRK